MSSGEIHGCRGLNPWNYEMNPKTGTVGAIAVALAAIAGIGGVSGRGFFNGYQCCPF